MPKPKIAVFSGPRATVTNSPPLVTSNKARLPGEPLLPGRFDHLVGQLLHEPVTVRIQEVHGAPAGGGRQTPVPRRRPGLLRG